MTNVVELVEYEIRLNGERVGIFTGSPADRMRLVDALACLSQRFNEDDVASVLRVIEDQTRVLNDIADRLEAETTGADDAACDIRGVVDELKSIDVPS